MLYSIFQSHKDEQVHKWTHYFPVYERFFKDFVNKSLVMYEIGVSRGGSLQLWKKYLGPFATIVGIDINEASKKYEDEQCKVRIGDQADLDCLRKVVDEFGQPDIVVDDGSHVMRDLDVSFRFLYPLLNNNGVYIVEDAHSCYLPEFGGGLGKPSSFIEKAKEMIDVLNSYHYKKEDKVDDFAKSTFSISFFDSMIVFEKRRRGKPYDLMRGNPDL